jgi:hypothetical protein
MLVDLEKFAFERGFVDSVMCMTGEEFIDDHEPDIVPGPGIGRTGITKSDDQQITSL